MKLVKEEWDSPKNEDPSKVKSLFIRTHAFKKNGSLSEGSNPTAYSVVVQEYKMLKKSLCECTVYIVLSHGYFYVLQAFELTMQR